MSFDFAPVRYMERTRLYYEAQGFEDPYHWAHHEDAPITRLKQPLSDSKLALISTAAPYPRKELDPRSVHAIDNDRIPERLHADDLAWDKEATHLDDRSSFFPIEILLDFAAEGIIGSVARRSYFLPTEYSQRKTRDIDTPTILQHCIEVEVDCALLVPL